MAEVYLGVGIDASGARTGANEFDRAIDKVDRGANRATKSTADFERQLAQAKVALIAAGTAATYFAIRTISEYTTSLSKAQAVTNATAQEMMQLEKATRELGATTMFSAGQAADAVTALGMAGFETNQILEALPATLDLAAAAGLGMGQAADIASNIMSGFNIEAERMTEIADVLAAVASSANTDVTGMGEAMKYVGPIARSIGITMQDTAAAVGVLANTGIQGSMAGTALKTSLSSLVNPTKQAQKAIKSLGLDIKDLNPQTNDFTEVVKRLADAGLDAERAFQIFGQRGATAMLALTDNVSGLIKLSDVTNNASGAAERMATIMTDNVRGDATRLESALGELAHTMGDAGLTGAVRGVLQAGTDFVIWLTDVLKTTMEDRAAFEALKTSVELLTVAMVALAASQAIVWIQGMTAAVWASVTAVTALDVAFLGLPITWLLASLGLLALAIYKIATNWEYVGEVTHNTIMSMTDTVKRFIAGVWVEFSWLLNFLVNRLDWIKEFAKTVTKQAFYSATNQTAKFAQEQKRFAEYTKNQWKNAWLSESERETMINQMIGKKAEAQINRSGINLFKALRDGIMSGDLLSAAQELIAPIKDTATGVIDAFSGKKIQPKKPRRIMDEETEKIKKLESPYAEDGMMSLAFEQMAIMKQESETIIKTMQDQEKAKQSYLEGINKQLESEQKRLELTKEYKGNMTEIDVQMQLYNATREYGIEIGSEEYRQLEEKIRAQKEVAKEMNNIKKETDEANKSGEQWARSMTSAFKDAIMNSKNLGDALNNLANRVQSVLINKALDSLLGGIFSGFGFAKGGAFSGGQMVAYASGGVIDTPLMFPMAGNKTGLMGEAGPEAIMPLTRTPSGDLGVRAVGGGGGSIAISNIYNISVEGGDKEQNQDAANRVSGQIRRDMDDMVMNILNREQRPGGVLNGS